MLPARWVLSTLDISSEERVNHKDLIRWESIKEQELFYNPREEEAVARLERLVARMESGAEDLDAMVKDFEEGRALVDFCGKKLTAIERKVEILARRADGSVAALEACRWLDA